MEEELLGFVSNVMDWRMINVWDDEKACPTEKRTTVLPNISRVAPAADTETSG